MPMALADNILSLVITTPGLTEAEIAARLFGRKAYQQRVNSTCRRLIRESRIERRGTGGPGQSLYLSSPRAPLIMPLGRPYAAQSIRL